MNILLVEDDDSIAVPLADGLRREGFEVVRVASAGDALAAGPSDIVLLDLRLPDMDGLEVCRELRARSAVPIIVVSARGEEVDRVIGLELGADDYVVKPFGIRELVARIRAVARRSAAVQDGSERIDVGRISIDLRETQVQTLTPGPAGGLWRLLFAQMTPEGKARKRARSLTGLILRNPRFPMTALRPNSWSKRTIILLVMQTADNCLTLRASRRPGGGLQTEQSRVRPNPAYIPIAHEVAERLANRIGGTAQGSLSESLANIAATAHPMGGAVIGADAEHGVVDVHHRVFGYEGLLVCDGSAIPANAGVNPSLTITAMSEHAMSHVEVKPGAVVNPVVVHTPVLPNAVPLAAIPEGAMA